MKNLQVGFRGLKGGHVIWVGNIGILMDIGKGLV
jgi:hypothetical protein